MVTLAREARELTQADLAQRLGISQGLMSKIENGIVQTPAPVLEGLASTLGFPEAFFSQPDSIHGVGTDTFHQMYRRRKALPMKTLKRIEARVNISRMHADRMLKAVNIEPGHGIPRLEVDDFDGDIERIAATVRASWLLPSGPVDNVVKCIEDAGGMVIPFDFGTQQVDATSLRYRDLPPLMFQSNHLLGDRQRFTLSHELGHMVMHSIVPNANMEKEADRFAAEFLMPAQEIGPQLVNLTLHRAAQLKRYWRVSMAAIIYRASSLAKITENQARYLRIQMGTAGLRTREPVELDVPVERPRLQRELIELHLKDLGYSASELCMMLASTPQDFAELHRDTLPTAYRAGFLSASNVRGENVVELPRRQ
jgi:Zn-dependent peptidase ImmA (M78 family)